MGVEFYEEESPKMLRAEPQKSGLGSLAQKQLVRGVSAGQLAMVCFALLSFYGAYLLFSIRPMSQQPTQAEIRAMADLVRK